MISISGFSTILHNYLRMYSNGSEMLGSPSFPVQWRWWRGLLPASRHPCSHPSGTSSPWTKTLGNTGNEKNRKRMSTYQFFFSNVRRQRLDPHHFDVDPDSTYHPDADPDADPDPYFYFMRIRIFIWCGCGSGSSLPKLCGFGSTTLPSVASNTGAQL